MPVKSRRPIQNTQHSTLTYRARQFVAALRAEVRAEEYELVSSLLTAGEQRLFTSMPTYDQRHCLDVYLTLVDAGYCDPILLRAALIHDCGKVDDDGRPMSLGWYVLATILKRMPALYLAFARGGSMTIRPIYVYAEHAWRGARLAAAAGSPPELVAIIRHYHDPAPNGPAAALQWADEQH
ncbi:MAG: hypothetical protein HGA65_07995 [Oscillochloris sp.]|nr:hypothetical protein [Oscillochloris sp.]